MNFRIWGSNNWKLSLYEMCPNTEFFLVRIFFWFVSLRIQSECGKIRTRKNTVLGHFSRSGCLVWNYCQEAECCIILVRYFIFFCYSRNRKSEYLKMVYIILSMLFYAHQIVFTYGVQLYLFQILCWLFYWDRTSMYWLSTEKSIRKIKKSNKNP